MDRRLGRSCWKQLLEASLVVSAHKEQLCHAHCEEGRKVEELPERSHRREREARFCPGSSVVEWGQKQGAMGTGKSRAWKSPSGLVPVKRVGASHESLFLQARQSGCMSLPGEMPRTALSSSLGDFASLELPQAHACPYFYLLVKHFPTKRPSRWGLEVEVSLVSALLAHTGKELSGCLAHGQVRECHLRGYSLASSFHLLYV